MAPPLLPLVVAAAAAAGVAGAWSYAGVTGMPPVAYDFQLTTSSSGSSGGDVVYRFGGRVWDANTQTETSRNDVYAFDGAAWSVVHPGTMGDAAVGGAAPLPPVSAGAAPGRRAGACVGMWGGSLVVAFGSARDGGGAVNYADVWTLPVNGTATGATWVHRAVASGSSTPPGRSTAACGIVGDKLVVFGGYAVGTESVLGDTWVLDLVSMTWGSVAQHARAGTPSATPPATFGAAAGIVSPGWLVVAGGLTPHGDGSLVFMTAMYALALDAGTPAGAPTCTWVHVPLSGTVPTRALGGGFVWAGTRLCVASGVQAIVSNSAVDYADGTTCCEVAPYLAYVAAQGGGGGAGRLRRLRRSLQAQPLPPAAVAPTVAWRYWGPDVGLNPSPRMRPGATAYSPAAGGGAVWELIAGGVDTSGMDRDAYTAPLPAFPDSWRDLPTPPSYNLLALFGYFLYGGGILLLSIVCLICAARRMAPCMRPYRADALARAEAEAAVAAAAGGYLLPGLARPVAGVPAGVLESLPTMVYKPPPPPSAAAAASGGASPGGAAAAAAVTAATTAGVAAPAAADGGVMPEATAAAPPALPPIAAPPAIASPAEGCASPSAVASPTAMPAATPVSPTARVTSPAAARVVSPAPVRVMSPAAAPPAGMVYAMDSDHDYYGHMEMGVDTHDVYACEVRDGRLVLMQRLPDAPAAAFIASARGGGAAAGGGVGGHGDGDGGEYDERQLRRRRQRPPAQCCLTLTPKCPAPSAWATTRRARCCACCPACTASTNPVSTPGWQSTPSVPCAKRM